MLKYINRSFSRTRALREVTQILWAKMRTKRGKTASWRLTRIDRKRNRFRKPPFFQKITLQNRHLGRMITSQRIHLTSSTARVLNFIATRMEKMENKVRQYQRSHRRSSSAVGRGSGLKTEGLLSTSRKQQRKY